jgi:phospholipid/cholesterol/gamma-HCH transport system substrate-binding protein
MVMTGRRTIEVTVGLFMLFALAAFLVLVYKVSGFSVYGAGSSYTVAAEFDNIGDLKVRAPVAISGVRVGEVAAIYLDPTSFKAKVKLRIDDSQSKIPSDSTARILTEGLLGSNYVSLTPGFAESTFLHSGSLIQDTHPALILENIIGQLMFSLKNNKK